KSGLFEFAGRSELQLFSRLFRCVEPGHGADRYSNVDRNHVRRCNHYRTPVVAVAASTWLANADGFCRRPGAVAIGGWKKASAIHIPLDGCFVAVWRFDRGYNLD